MNNNLSPDLAPYQGIILSLVAYANHHKLDHLIEKLTPKLKSSVRFLIKMEIKRVAKPCNLVMDFRAMFDNCEEVHHNEQCHYLDEISKALFLESVQNNQNNFCIYMYNELTQGAKARYVEQKRNQTEQEKRLNNSLNVAVASPINLSNQNYFHEDPNSFHSKCRVFTYDPLGMSLNGKLAIGKQVELIDLNISNCIFKTTIDITDIENDELFLWFYDHDKILNFEPEITLPYKVVNKEYNNGFYHYHLKLSQSSAQEMLTLLTKLLQHKFAANKPHRKKQILPLIDSVMAKSHEQYLTSRITDIPLLCAKYTSGWRPDSGLFTESNKDLWRFFSDNESLAPFSKLFSHEHIQQALDNNERVNEYAYILKHQYADKNQFIIVWQHQLENDQKARTLLQETILAGEYRFVRLSIKPVNAVDDAYLPSAVASSTSPAMAFMNRPLSRPILNSLKPINYIAVLTDITELNNTLAIPEKLKVKPQPLHEIAPIKCASQFLLPRLTRKSQLKKVVLDLHDSRREERFSLEMDIKITRCGKSPCKIKGHTVNISSRGLAVHLAQPLAYKAGDIISLTLKIPTSVDNSAKNITLRQQKYQILAGDDTQLRLVISGIEKRHDGCKFLREFILNNMDDLQLASALPGEIYGMSQAIRNIYAKNHLSVPFFIHQDKRQWYINSLALNADTKFPSLSNEQASDQDMLVKLINQEKFQNYCLIKLNKIAEQKDFNVFYMVTVPQVSAKESEKLFWFGDLEQLQKSGKLPEVMGKIKALGNPTIVRVQISKPQGIAAKGFIDELHYLKKISPNDANELISTIEQVAGIGEVTDHTEQVLAIVYSYFANKTAQDFAKAG